MTTLVDKIKANWQAWVLQGIPAAAVVLGAAVTFGSVYGNVDQRIKALEGDRAATAIQMRELTDQIGILNLSVQQLKDRLQMRGDIMYVRPTRNHLESQPNGISSMPSDYNPNLR